MKYLYIFMALVAGFTISSCSKGGDATPFVHNIRFQATGTAAITPLVSVMKSSAVTSTTLDTKTVATGTAYDFTSAFTAGDVVHFEIQTMTENSISYTISDNGTVVAQVTGKEQGSFSKITLDFPVN
ncbi:hypothetical protein [Mucilaginibacter glaciei]|uniref:Uncharacterized protein n=1 Tax=Mucilaginibacter glaciei TaxID=2772109 RepID=A0A926NRZ3_9SPHI|nr:hypothetical protein [Mucilaginibacter glaciei]MBD1393562.1 hypothetical protein [Mucilaginibacter glaciei]